MTHPALRPLNEAQASRFIWFVMIVGVAAMLAVTTFVRWKLPEFGANVDALAWGAIAIAAGGFVASRAIARLMPAPDARRVRTRMIVQLALGDAGATAGGIGWLLTGNPWSWVAVGLGVLGLVLAYPGRALAEGNASSRMTR